MGTLEKVIIDNVVIESQNDRNAPDLEDVLDRVVLEIGRETFDVTSSRFEESIRDGGTRISNALEIDTRGFELEAGESEEFVLYFEFEEVDEEGKSGAYVSFDVIYTVITGNSTDEQIDKSIRVTERVDLRADGSITSTDLVKAVAFASALSVETVGTGENFESGDRQKVYQFSVEAEGGDSFLKQVELNVSTRINATTADWYITEGGRSSTKLTEEVSSGDEGGNTITLVFSDVEEINEDETRTFSVYADLGKSDIGEEAVLSVRLKDEDFSASFGQTFDEAKSGSFIWSPGTGEDDPTLTTNDWFNGGALFDDVESWRLD